MPVLYEKRDRVGIITLSRPAARNAWGQDFNEGLLRCFADMDVEERLSGGAGSTWRALETTSNSAASA